MTDLDQKLASRLARLRRQSGWTLDQLAERSGISRASLSRMERGDTSPTASVLGQLARAYRVPMAELFAGAEDQVGGHVARKDQEVWRDPESGFERRAVSPAAQGFRATVIEGCITADGSVSYDQPPVPGLEHHLVLLEGELEVTLESEAHRLSVGDCLRFRLNGPNRYRAIGPQDARYLLTVVMP
ncbi:helix-turn-helix domain-containing protein [Roseibium sp.]|uniref:helix-turn-helix domain-containing protein n=1 Tax=Roseibium sp. TaxID=1936156 RepID=UPI003A96E2D3